MRRDNFVKKLSTAIERAAGNPILKISVPAEIRGSEDHAFYLPIEGIDRLGQMLVEIQLLTPGGKLAGQISLRHLNRLGNANHAEIASKKIDGLFFGYPDAFPAPAVNEEKAA